MIEQLESAAKQLAQEIGKHNLTREAVCTRAKVAEGSFGYQTGMKFSEWIKSLNLPETDHPYQGLRLTPHNRMNQIIDTALNLSKDSSYMAVQFEDIAKELEITVQLVKHYYPSIDILRDLLMCEAIKCTNYEIIAQGLINKHPKALALNTPLKTEAVRSTLMR